MLNGRVGLASAGAMLALTAWIGAADNSRIDTPGGIGSIDKHVLLGSFLNDHAGSAIYESEHGRITRVYGRAFSSGATAADSAAGFLAEYAGIWGVPADELLPQGPFADRRHVQGLMYDELAGQYRFTGLYYTQARDGVPVFRSKLCLLMRNEDGFPLVLASADLRDLGDFEIADGAETLDDETLQTIATNVGGPGAGFSGAVPVIWAGVDDMIVDAPRLATSFVVENAGPAGPFKEQVVADAQTGAVLFAESLILFADVEGSVVAQLTEGLGADICGPESYDALPYIEVNVPGVGSAYTALDGSFMIPDAGTSPVTVEAELIGQWFRVINDAGPEASLQMTVTPGSGTADFEFNEANANELERAEVNAYLHANVVRDFVLSYNPSYPTIGGQTQWPVNVNLGSNCNAFYNGNSINFYTSGGGCSNTANSTVVYHEYGHHLVNVGGSGQGAYGEGMSDSIGVIITEQPNLALGFFSNCNEPLRSADNNCLYLQDDCSTCGGAIHSCGRLISGCVYDTYVELVSSDPATAQDVIAALTINSILLHNGTSIEPSIGIDFLTLDDDDSDIGNGTPHYGEIEAGFNAHDMQVPPLSLLAIEFPSGVPQLLVPNVEIEILVRIQPLADAPVPGSERLFIDGGIGFLETSLVPQGDDMYLGTLPAGECGDTVSYYVAVDTVGGTAMTYPDGAPTYAVPADYASDVDHVALDRFESDTGWTVTNSGGLSAGAWERGVPVDNGADGDPTSDADGSNKCYLTGNASGNSDVDGGSTTLTSPMYDASIGQPVVSYFRWFANHTGNNPQEDIMEIEVSGDDGASWVPLETVGPSGSEAEGGWKWMHLPLADVAGLALTDQFRLRVTVSDLGGASVVEAGFDHFALRSLNCACEADISGDGTVDVTDLLDILAAWGGCGLGCDEDIDGSGAVDVTDLLIVLAAWGPCP